jgi:ubiquinone/menaquinone biosynthesis C-methylase UbiE
MDRVLDVGCGSGWLELFLAPHVGHILAVDTSPRLVETTRQRCVGLDHVNVQLLREPYTDIAQFGENVSLVLCNSVIQYYRSVEEVEALIESARRIVKPGGRMLISDINLKRNRLQRMCDTCFTLLVSFRERYTLPLARALWNRCLRGSEYTLLESTEELLTFAMEEIDSLIKRLDLQAEIIHADLSVNANRPSLLIYF